MSEISDFLLDKEKKGMSERVSERVSERMSENERE